jgi:hypothetical protein
LREELILTHEVVLVGSNCGCEKSEFHFKEIYYYKLIRLLRF